MRAILVVGFVLLLVKAYGNEIIWHEGSVVLEDKQVLAGTIARQSQEVILFKSSKEITVLPAHKVSLFRYFDKQEEVNRIFIAAAGKFYERIVNGKISVWRMQKVFNQEINEKHQDAFDFWIEENKRVYSMSSFRKRFFDKVKEELDLKLVSYKQLDPNSRLGAVSLIILYNKSLAVVI